MTLLTGETEVFSSAQTAGRCVVMFLLKRQREPGEMDAAAADGVQGVLKQLEREDWHLSIRKMFDAHASPNAFVLDTGFAHDVDIAGVFEAPSLAAALRGTVRLEQAGWDRLFTTEWLLGPREFAVVAGIGASSDRPWGFLALWEWNDAWSAASPDERRDYDAECDVAFRGDLGFNINIAGRHRLDWAHGWHHLGIWEAASPEIIDAAISGHEQASDFMFTTSRHIIGRVTPLDVLIR
ncbi:hypothetical protein ASD99_21185 [Mesorhizobium sp. Root695]|uniref:hypothetical protein n=1 Tax=Mesorhizobium sp. Root695 TaxID=1736589 RepID=UPI000711056F|nr:hypothetical protein [Mesorhizobium sp. Root695]KRB30933.1 hypothetical protein ASD99_21185 [Mesorhizobium sp. Root695]